SRLIRLNNGDEPSLVLHRSGKTEIRAQPVISSNAGVGERTSAGQKLLADLLVAEIELEAVACTEPIIGPCLRTLARAPNPTAQQIAFICIAVYPRRIKVEKARANLASQRVIRVDALDSQI